MPPEKEILLLFADYMQWAVGYDDPNRCNYPKAADVLLAFIQKHCSHPCIFFDYQLPSFTYLVKQMHQYPVDYRAFKHLVKQLLASANQGQLPDARFPVN